jgi:hypothetical protein
MTVVGFVLALVGFALAFALWYRSQQQHKAEAELRQALQEQASVADERRKESDGLRKEADERVSRLEADLADAMTRQDDDAMAEAMWRLELERSHRQWRDVIVPADVARMTDGSTGTHLAFAIGQEVDRLREEVGVSIRTEGGFAAAMTPRVALGALRIVEEVLALAAKRADEIAVAMREVEVPPSIEVVLTCEGWDDEGDVASEALNETITGMAARLDGIVSWTTASEGRVQVAIDLPVARVSIVPEEDVVVVDLVAEPADVTEPVESGEAR